MFIVIYFIFNFFFISYYFIQHLNSATSPIYIIKLFTFPLIFYNKHIIFFLNSINRIVLIKWSNARETLIHAPNASKEKMEYKTNVNLEMLN